SPAPKYVTTSSSSYPPGSDKVRKQKNADGYQDSDTGSSKSGRSISEVHAFDMGIGYRNTKLFSHSILYAFLYKVFHVTGP
ncbi:hypothetical protein CARUB_v10010791mg, partial [Capsella rubella]